EDRIRSLDAVDVELRSGNDVRLDLVDDDVAVELRRIAEARCGDRPERGKLGAQFRQVLGTSGGEGANVQLRLQMGILALVETERGSELGKAVDSVLEDCLEQGV